MMELLKQPLCHPLQLHEQVILLWIANHGMMDQIDSKQIKIFQREILSDIENNHPSDTGN